MRSASRLWRPCAVSSGFRGWSICSSATDAILVSGFIGLTGGIVSYFSSLYLLPIIAASIISFRRGAFQVAVLSGVLYLGLVTAQYLALFPEWLGGDAVELPGRQFAQYTIAINLSGFTAVALLSGSLAERLRHAQSRLRDASHEIQDLRAFNEYVIDGLLSGLVTTDADCRVLTFNRAASAITGIPREQAVGHDAVEVLQLPSDLRSRLETLFQTRSLRVEFDYRTGEGRQLDVGLMVTMIALPNGRNGYLFTFQDVTELRRLERTGRLQQRLAAVGEMAAGIAHEIRNPLAAMSGSIQVLQAGALTQRRSGAINGHRAARIRALERHNPFVSRLRASAEILDRESRPRAK